jgi:DNA-binding transcriptional MocR family regulator
VHRARAAGVPSPNARPSVRRGFRIRSACERANARVSYGRAGHPLASGRQRRGIICAILNEASARQKLAADVLVQHAYSRHPNGHHIWVPLPRNWGKTELASHVQRQGLAITTAESFSVGESQPDATRVSLGTASGRVELFRALEILATILKSSAARARVV